MSLQGRVMAAVDAWRSYGLTQNRTADAQASRYALLGAFYQGTWAADPRWPQMVDVYRNARQVVKTTKAIVDTYEQLVYAGTLPLPGKELPEGTLNAIPIVPETGSESTDEALTTAFLTNFDIWRWRSRMALIPKTAAIYGDLLVELVDDYTHGIVSPILVNPWEVPADSLELDANDNIKAYAVEYDVDIADSTAFGRTVKGERYRYRKEVDGLAFRYYKDGRPWSDPEGHGNAVQPNPYGFAPACWFRHEVVVGSDRGMGAFEGTLVQAMEISSLLSSAIDYQRKQFGAPVGIVGSAAIRPGRTYTMPGGISVSTSTTQTQVDAARRGAAEEIHLLSLDENGKFVTVQFDIGATRELLAFLYDNMIAENPVAKYAQLLGELKMATGPGVKMTLAPIIADVQGVQANHDPQMVKLAQMGTAIMGFRLKSGDIPAALVTARSDRYDAFRPFDLTSYGRGLLDASIADRDPFPPSKLEEATWLAIAAELPPWALRRLGIAEEDIVAQEEERRHAQEAQLAAFSVVGAGGSNDEQTAGGGGAQE